MINPIAITFGPLEIRWYGIIIAIGILIALEWTMRRSKARGLELALVERATFAAILGGIVGARLIYVAQNISYFTAHADRILAFTDGGLSIHGALLGGALALFIAIGFDRKQFARIADATMPGLSLAMILGRLGNFANAELFGPPTNLPWKLFIPVASRPTGLADVAFYHPTFLYDIILNSIVLFLLLKFEHKMNKPGQLTLWFFLGIAITRFIVEFWRIGDSTLLGLSLAQIVSVLIASFSASVLMRRRLTL